MKSRRRYREAYIYNIPERTRDVKMIVSELFVEDALVYIVTYLPLLYFFSDPVLLFSVSHITSFLCAPALYSKQNDKLAFYQTLFAFLCVSFTIIADSAMIVRGVCQFVSSEFCCEVFQFVDIPCYKNPLLGVLLVPLTFFNTARCLLRAYALYGATDHGKAPGLGILTGIKIASLALLVAGNKTERDKEKLALILATYSLIILASMMMEEKDPFRKRDGIFAWFFALDVGNLSLQALGMAAGETTSAAFYLALASFSVATLLLIATVGDNEEGRTKLGDAFSTYYTAISVAVLLYCGGVLYPYFSPWVAFGYFLYAGTLAGKYHFCFFRKYDDGVLAAAVVFVAVDFGAVLFCLLMFAGVGNVKIRREKLTEAALFFAVAACALVTSVSQLWRRGVERSKKTCNKS